MQILDKIVRAQRNYVERKKAEVSVSALENSDYFLTPARSMAEALLNGESSGIIAEFKRRSPSRGTINSTARPVDVCPQYLEAGASALSVLTNQEFFGGSDDDFLTVRRVCNGVLMRKEFIIDEYQVIESRSIGADAILLIADILSAKELRDFSALARSLGMETLFEIHDVRGIDKLPGDARLTGINSRNLDNFTIDMDLPEKMIGRLPETVIRIAESGIDSPEKLVELRNAGFSGFLIGELFMKDPDPGAACEKFIRALGRTEQKTI